MTDQTPSYITVPSAGDTDGTRDTDNWAPSDGSTPPYNQADMPGVPVIDAGLFDVLFGDEDI